MTSSSKSTYGYPKTSPNRRPPGWWYVGWVIYANRSTVVRAFALFVVGGIVLFAAGHTFDIAALIWASYALAVLGLLLLINAVVGLTLVYGPPAASYVRRLLGLGAVRMPGRVADLHIGTYRISYMLAESNREW